ncbi:HpcH/HpaI aldolase/citrate lyase family protein [Streptomyces mirabilis]|uniref:HpcH/HpaI aldolase/citrate lyase family protein n=1 Tax=Streptomyces mirabilis TaxID=68239 RepID=UPI003322F228
MTITPNRRRRNMLLIPGNFEDHIQKALTIPGVDSVILDLEDLVAPSKKDATRKTVCDLIQSGVFREKGIEVVVRINHMDTPYYVDDIQALMEARPDMLRISKVERREDVLAVDSLLNAYEKKLGYPDNTVYLMAAIESAIGVLNSYEIASSCPRIIGMALASADYCQDIKMVRTRGGLELDWARGMLLHSARAAGAFVCDTSFIFDDQEALEKESVHAKQLGFDGKTIAGAVPESVAIVNKAFTPTAEQVAYAKKVLAMAVEYGAAGDTVALDGDVILDKPVIEQYKHVLRYAGELDG